MQLAEYIEIEKAAIEGLQRSFEGIKDPDLLAAVQKEVAYLTSQIVQHESILALPESPRA